MSSNINDPTGLSRFFHLNSEPWVKEHTSPATPFVQTAKSYSAARRVALPETDSSFVESHAAARRSERTFCDAPLALQDFAALLRAGYRAVGPDHLDNGQKILRRPVPSAGGLYPLEIYALVRNVEGLVKGVYHYEAVGNQLELIKDGAWEAQAEKALISWSYVEQAPVILCIASVFERTQTKYGPRGYRYVLLEAGHVAQNLCLVAAEMNLSSLCMGGFYDSLLNQLISLDGLEEAVVYTVALGAPSGG